MKIKKLPNVLALHLKRFKYQEDVQKYIKLTYRVAFPFELRLFNTVDDAQDPDRLYQLFAIVVHIGKSVLVSCAIHARNTDSSHSSGPNHGHYVAIVKSRGSWVVFDDDSVDTIKESEIPRYFGDSNCGSAYVLYYQAVDLDLGALGLRTAARATAESPNPAVVADSVDVSPNLSSRLLPPGLSVNTDATTSDSGLATSSSSSSRPNCTPQPLTVSISPPEPSTPAPVPTSPGQTVTTPVAKSGGFSILRHTASLRGLTPSMNKASTSQSAQPLPPIPSSSTPAVPITTPPDTHAGPNEPLSPLPASPSAPLATAAVNGKTKSSKDWSGGWFMKRRSMKAEKSPETMPILPRRASVHESDKIPHPSTHNTTQTGVLKSNGDSSLVPPPSEDTKDPYPSTSLLSAPLQLPSIPSTSSASSYGKHVASHNRHLPDHKKSHPILKTTETEAYHLPRSPTSTTLPTILNGHITDSPPPPVPSLPSDLRNAALSDKSNSPEANDSSQRNSSPPSQSQSQSHPPSSIANKRTSRKLSFTGSGLFGRKDKHKDNKDKDMYSSNHSSVVPGMSIISRI